MCFQCFDGLTVNIWKPKLRKPKLILLGSLPNQWDAYVSLSVQYDMILLQSGGHHVQATKQYIQISIAAEYINLVTHSRSSN